MTTKHTPTPWTVSYMVREQKGDYLAAVEELEAGHEALVKALEAMLRRVLPHTRHRYHGPMICDTSEVIKQAQAALKLAQEEA